MAESRSEIDVADLQHSLRECIERVRSGEHVTVTEAGRPVARSTVGRHSASSRTVR